VLDLELAQPRAARERVGIDVDVQVGHRARIEGSATRRI
jgi:hypothetical protein